MEKVRLTLDELQVQSFATTEAAGKGQGTVRGHDVPTDQVECPTANVNWDTCWASCADTNCCGSGGDTDNCTYDCWSDWCGSWTWWISWC
jgi:hypothetical protein